MPWYEGRLGVRVRVRVRVGLGLGELGLGLGYYVGSIIGWGVTLLVRGYWSRDARLSIKYVIGFN